MKKIQRVDDYTLERQRREKWLKILDRVIRLLFLICSGAGLGALWSFLL